MDTQELKNYLSLLAVKNGYPADNMNDFLNAVIKLAISDAWYSYEWAGRSEANYELAVTGIYTDLPANFDKFVSITQREWSQGLELWYYPEKEFNNKFPKPSAVPGNSAQAFTIFRDNHSWKLAVVPDPGTVTLYLTYLKTVPTTLSQVPGNMYPFVVACAVKYITGEIDINEELRRAQVMDGPVGDMGGRMFDETDEPKRNRWAGVTSD